MKKYPKYIPKLTRNKEGYFVLGEMELKAVEECSIKFKEGKAEGLALLTITLPVITSLSADEQAFLKDQSA